MLQSTVKRAMSTYAPLEGLLAFNKPTGISSAQALRNLQKIFNQSPIFAETLEQERSKRAQESKNQQNKRRSKRGPVGVKIGHGGTLDPMATGVLVAGIGGATKVLQQFISCRKSYEAVALFGCSTDTYDAEGKILRRAPHQHITKEAVEEALCTFRGDIMQKPPIYSALHHEGKRFYEYAREGKPLPIEIKPRPVTVDSIELVNFTTNHTYSYPKEDASEEDKIVGKALHEQEGEVDGARIPTEEPPNRTAKRPGRGGPKPEDEPVAKRRKPEDNEAITATTQSLKGVPTDIDTVDPSPAALQELRPAAVTIRMTVTSGFYVRSLIHDLGEALGSAAHMVKLVRTQQGQFELGKNVIEWEDIMSQDASTWEGKVEDALRTWAVGQPDRKLHHDGRANHKLEGSSGRTKSPNPEKGTQGNVIIENPNLKVEDSGTSPPPLSV